MIWRILYDLSIVVGLGCMALGATLLILGTTNRR